MKVNEICCIGAGYVGGPTMAVIALKCPEIKVTVVDINSKRISAWNDKNFNNLPVFEPGLAEVVSEARGRNLFFSTDIDSAISRSEIIFMAVNTPTKTEGKGAGMAADLKYVEACAVNIAKVANSDKIVVEKSTLPVRTAETIKDILKKYGKDSVNFEILSNPEFLAEGTAVKDLFKSDRVLIGGDDTKTGQKAVNALVEIYARWIPRDKILKSNVWSSELSKLASNAMLAQRISSINSLSSLCEKTGADVHELSKAIGMDNRIGPKFLRASVGFGGSCFKKDILNLVYLCQNYGLYEVAEYWNQVLKINDYQRNRFVKKIINDFNDKAKKKTVSILGWAFKANTNDSRESASIYITNQLVAEGAFVKVYDPMVKESRIRNDLKTLWTTLSLKNVDIEKRNKSIKIIKDYKKALMNSDAIAILTEWDEFKKYPWSKIAKHTKIYDARKIIKKSITKASNIYSLGR